ncbi:tetratricopeptide repeat protein [Candidatus Peregrinibacteria bacterium]|nr:tetratricopeptide repeat protein [Candidatus Peregrinibacteria bacterium]
MDRKTCGPDDAVAVRVCARALERSGSPARLEEGAPDAARTLDERFLAAFPSLEEDLVREYRDCSRSQCMQLLAGACVRQGWVHLLSAREVTPLDWREKVMRYCAEELRVTGSTDETIISRLPVQPLIDGPDAAIADLLSARIPCDRYRTLLARAEAEGHVARLAAYEKMIAHHVFAEVALFDQWSEKPSAWQEEHGTPSYKKGYPSYVVAEKDGSCFGGLWLIAALLLRCGISPQHLCYCHVNQSHDEQTGPHGQLLLLTSQKEIMTMDHGYGSIGRRLSPFVWDDRAFIDMPRLLDGECAEPVIVTTPREWATVLQCPRSMVVSPLFSGIASEHYWHVGIEFFHEGKLPEAGRALEFAQVFCPKNPDVLYYRGLVASREGRNDEAREHFQGAIALFDGHLRAHYALGELAEHAGDTEEARRRYARVGESWNHVWGDAEFREIARMKLALLPVPPAEEPLTYQI